jgi:Uma2 family endonuclease
MPQALRFDPVRLEAIYERDADRYCVSLPLEHFMESTAQSTQRKITVESFDVIHDERPDIQCFSELLIQYPLPGKDIRKPARVVPDNMVFLHPEPIKARGSYMMPLQPIGPYFVMEYTRTEKPRKDYVDSRRKYEIDLKVPYYLLFHPESQDLIVFQMVRRKYIAAKPNAARRIEIPKLELEIGIKDEWVRYWFRGELVPLPGDLVKQLRESEKLLANAQRRSRTALRRAAAMEAARDAAEQAKTAAEQRAADAEAELARLREDMARRPANGSSRRSNGHS